VHDPLKQGLKLYSGRNFTGANKVEVHDPLKQGLKLHIDIMLSNEVS